MNKKQSAKVVLQVLEGSVPLVSRRYGESDIERGRRSLAQVDQAFAMLTNNDYWAGERRRWVADRLIPRLALAPEHLDELAAAP